MYLLDFEKQKFKKRKKPLDLIEIIVKCVLTIKYRFIVCCLTQYSGLVSVCFTM